MNLLQRVFLQEMQTVYNFTSSIRADIDDNNAIIQILELNIHEKFQRLQTETELSQELTFNNSVLISRLDNRMHKFENERREATGSKGAT